MAVTYSQELLDRATAYVGQPLGQRRYAEGMAEISQLYTAITGQPTGTCQQCQYSDFLAVVNAYIRESTRFLHPETMPDSKYIIALGFAAEIFTHADYSKAVTAENLTDEDAEFFISKGNTTQFLRKDGKPVVAPEADADKKPAPKLKADFQARFKELFASEADPKLTIEALTQHIEAKEADAAYELPAE